MSNFRKLSSLIFRVVMVMNKIGELTSVCPPIIDLCMNFLDFFPDVVVVAFLTVSGNQFADESGEEELESEDDSE